MNVQEGRALGRTAAVLLAVSAARWAWEARAPAPLPAPSASPALLEASDSLAREEALRTRPLEPGERLDPNRATEVELDRLPGVGPATARRWVHHRDSVGPFLRPEDLTAVRGIGPASLKRIGPFLDFGVPPPVKLGRSAPGADPARVDVNRADTLELQRLPGVGPALARRIAAARREGVFRRPEDLLRVRGIGPATLERLRPRIHVGR
ncbi:MAG: ComEA family DNA-binding protein [Gemmatimonadota bacterium]